MREWLGMGFVCVALGTGCASSSTPEQIMGNTNWLSACAATDECGGDLVCACGVCTAACTDDVECGGRGGGYCAALAEADQCGAAAPLQRACLASVVDTCDGDGGCTGAVKNAPLCIEDDDGDTHCFWADVVPESETFGEASAGADSTYCRTDPEGDGGSSWVCWPVNVSSWRYPACTDGYPELPCTVATDAPKCVENEAGVTLCFWRHSVPIGQTGMFPEVEDDDRSAWCRDLMQEGGTDYTSWDCVPADVGRDHYPACTPEYAQLPCTQQGA